MEIKQQKMEKWVKGPEMKLFEAIKEEIGRSKYNSRRFRISY